MIEEHALVFRPQNGWNKSVILLPSQRNSLHRKKGKRIKRQIEGVLLSLMNINNTWVEQSRPVRLNESILWSWPKKQIQILSASILNFLDIHVVSSKAVYDKIQSSVPVIMDFRFRLARSMIWNFCNRKIAVPTSRPSNRSNGEKAMVICCCWSFAQFAATRATCAYGSAKKVESHIHSLYIMYHSTLPPKLFLSTSYNHANIFGNWLYSCSYFKLLMTSFMFSIIKNVNMVWLFIIILYQITLFFKNI